jgi:hypothetical protein
MVKFYNITRTLYKVSDFITFLKSNNLDLSPRFQRRSVWSKGTKSFLIDTIIRGLPIPIVFLRDRGADPNTFESKREVIDGQQRIRTVISYVAPNLAAKSLKEFDLNRDSFVISRAHNKDFANKNFSQLDENVRQRILDYQLSVHILPLDVDGREILEIFMRINSTFYELKPQELRNARFFGEFKMSVYNLAAGQLNRWRQWQIFSDDDISRMEEVELTSELVYLMFSGISSKTKTILDKVYEDKDNDYPERKVAEKRFQLVMDNIEQFFGQDMSSSPYSKKTLFYSFFAVFYDLLIGLNTTPKKNIKVKSISNSDIKLIKNSEDVFKSKPLDEIYNIFGRRTTDIKTRRALFNFIRYGGKNWQKR